VPKLTTLVLWVTAPALIGTPGHAEGRIEARWSQEEAREVLRGLNNNNKALLRKYVGVIDERESLDLRGIDLSGQKLHDVWIFGRWVTHLDGANLRGTVFANVDLRGAHLSHVDARDSVFKNGTRLDYARIEQADFSGSRFHSASFVGARIEDTSFGNVELEKVNFFGAQKIVAAFDYSSMAEVRFMRASLADCSFYSIVATELDFEGARLTEVSFRRAAIKDFRLDYANIERVDFRNANTTEVSLVGTSLYRPFMSGWNLDALDFRYVIWRNRDYRLGEEAEIFGRDRYFRRSRLEALQLRNAYSSLANRHDEYGYSEAARTFEAYTRRVENRLLRSWVVRSVDWLANELTHEYGRNPFRLALAAIVVVGVFTCVYVFLAVLGLRWCRTREARLERMSGYISFGREEEENEKDDAGWEWLRPSADVGFLEVVLGCTSLSLNMLFFSAGGFLKIPQVLSLIRLRNIEYNLRGIGRIVGGSEALLGVWLLFLLFRDFVELMD